MRFKNFFTTLPLFVSLLGCGSGLHDSSPKAVSGERFLLNSRTAELEGFAAINTLMQQRLLDPALPVTANFAIESVGGPGILDVKEMLGSYTTDGDRSDFLHGEPNPFNIMLWQNQLGIVAQAMGRACPESGLMEEFIVFPDTSPDLAFPIKPELLSLLQSLCRQPVEKSPDPQNLENIWLQVMSYDAPQEEELAWQSFFLDKNLIWPSRTERFSAVFLTMFTNPYFILQE